MKVDGCVALVTGGASGIGRCTVSALARAGAKKVYILDVDCTLGKSAADEISADPASKGCEVLFHHCDVTKDESVSGVFKHLEEQGLQADILVACAGIFDEKNWRKTIDVNFTGVALTNFAAIEHMGKHNGGKGGVIVNLGSIAGIVVRPTAPIYSAMKKAVVSLGRDLASDSNFSNHGIRINCVCPTLVETPLGDKILKKDNMYHPEWIKVAHDQYYNNLFKPQDVTDTIMALITDDNSKNDVMVMHANNPTKEPVRVDFTSLDQYDSYKVKK